MRSVVTLYFLLALALSLKAQIPEIPSTGYVPIGTTGPPEGLAEGYDVRLNTYLSAIDPNEPKAIRKGFEEQYRSRHKSIVGGLNGDDLIFGHPLNEYLDNILRTILEAQPESPGEVRLLVSRSTVPNAWCWGEGTIVITLGLLERLESEAQIAAVLSHELGHQYLHHSDHSIDEYVRLVNDKEFQKQVRSAVRGKYDRVARLESLLLGLAFDNRRHSRTHEFATDSLGAILLARTPYYTGSTAETMDVLDACDHEPYRDPLDLVEAFSRHGVRFNEEWKVERSASSMGYHERQRTALDDSLKTHPDCGERKAALLAQLERSGGARGSAFLQDEEQFHILRRISTYEIIDRLMGRKAYCRAFYLALRELDARPDEPYLKAVVAHSMAMFHKYQSERRIGFILDHTNNNYSRSYNRLLDLITEMRLSDYARTGYELLAKERATEQQHPDLLFALVLTSKAMNELVEARSYADRYRTLYPEGRHINALAELLP